MLTAQSWPISANMLAFGNHAPDGRPLKDAPATVWAAHLQEVRELGVTAVDPTDAWLPLAELSERQLKEFQAVLQDMDMTIPSISMTRRSVVDIHDGQENLEQAHRLIEIAPKVGATIVNTGFMQKLTPKQDEAVWFWLVKGHEDTEQYRGLALERIRELGTHAAGNGIQISLEMYEDTFIGTPDDAVAFLQDVDHEAVGLNPDLGNLVRLHRPIEDYKLMHEKVLPFANFWHIKNYTRDYDPQTGSYATAPVPLKYGYVNYRQMIQLALRHGFNGPFCCEHYGSDSLGVIAENIAYIREILSSHIK